MAKETMTKKAGFSLSAAAAGRTNTPKEDTAAPIEAKKAVHSTDKGYQRFNFICSNDRAAKARAISRKEGFTIRALMERAMDDFFEKYEAKNGEIGDLISKDINDVL